MKYNKNKTVEDAKKMKQAFAKNSKKIKEKADVKLNKSSEVFIPSFNYGSGASGIGPGVDNMIRLMFCELYALANSHLNANQIIDVYEDIKSEISLHNIADKVKEYSLDENMKPKVVAYIGIKVTTENKVKNENEKGESNER